MSGTTEAPVFHNSSVGTDLLWNAGYLGQGIVIANVEAGHVWSEHEVFRRQAVADALGIALPESPARKVNAPVSPDAPELGEVDYHATMVGHVLVGAGNFIGSDGSVNLSAVGAGMAPLATLWSGAIATRFDKTRENAGSFEISPESFRTPYVEFFTGAGHGRADVINSSWGFDDASGNAGETRLITALAAGNPGVTAVFSAGNAGLGADKIGGPGASFNVITVGSLGGPAGLTPSSFSSGGLVGFFDPVSQQTIPAARAAVHLAAPGENLALAAYLLPTGGLEPLLTPDTATSANDLYFVFSASGTSFSAPTVAGGVALLKDLIKTGPYALPKTEALDARVMRSVLMASAVRTESWDNDLQPTGPDGSLLTTRALDLSTGAGRMDVGRAALLYVGGTADVPGLVGGRELAQTGWDFGALGVGGINDYTLDLAAVAGGAELTVSLNWFVAESFDPLTGDTTFGSFANLDLEVWLVGATGSFDQLLAASRTLYNNSEFLRISVQGGGLLGLRVGMNGLTYDFDGIGSGGAVDYGLAWTTEASPIPEPSAASLWVGLAAALGAATRRRRATS